MRMPVLFTSKAMILLLLTVMGVVNTAATAGEEHPYKSGSVTSPLNALKYHIKEQRSFQLQE
jgi:hypothetical protein